MLTYGKCSWCWCFLSLKIRYSPCRKLGSKLGFSPSCGFSITGELDSTIWTVSSVSEIFLLIFLLSQVRCRKLLCVLNVRQWNCKFYAGNWSSLRRCCLWLLRFSEENAKSSPLLSKHALALVSSTLSPSSFLLLLLNSSEVMSCIMSRQALLNLGLA